MKVLFVASEVVPFAKTGGLGDVAGALPKALVELGHDVRVVMPRYRGVEAAGLPLHATGLGMSLGLGGVVRELAVLESVLPGTRVPIYFLNQPSLFDREGLYQHQGRDYPDNLERFSVFCQAALEVLPALGWQPEIVHCHDWQTGLVCAHLRTTRFHDPFWQSARTVFTVHNLAYQGLFPAEAFSLTGLPPHVFAMHGVEFYGQVNCLKAGLVYADLLTTVSPTYAAEIQTAEHGCALEGVLAGRRDDLMGILNGIDPEEWNPRTDPHLRAHFSVDEMAGKGLCKLALQERLGLPQRHGLLIGMIQRLVEQKGIDLIVQAADALLGLPVQIVLLGTGEPAYHQRLAALAKRAPEKLSVQLRFDNALAHQIEAGADAFLMPSRFEPCGLNQMYSLRYGTIPIVRRVGGLADTVVDVSPETLEAGTACGFVFEEYTPKALVQAVQRAAAAFGNHELWQRLIRTGMRQDFSWARSARAYIRVYERALNGAVHV